MKNHLRVVSDISIRDAMKTDDGTGTAMAAALDAHGQALRVQAHHWPAEDDVDAELRRAVAYRHGCLVADDEYLLGAEGAVDLARCEQSYSFFRATIAARADASPKRLTKSERAHVTLAAARYIAVKAQEMCPASRIEDVAKVFRGMGAAVSLPSFELCVPPGANEMFVAVTLVSELELAIRQADVVAPVAVPAKPTARQAPYLRLVK